MQVNERLALTGVFDCSRKGNNRNVGGKIDFEKQPRETSLIRLACTIKSSYSDGKMDIDANRRPLPRVHTPLIRQPLMREAEDATRL